MSTPLPLHNLRLNHVKTSAVLVVCKIGESRKVLLLKKRKKKKTTNDYYFNSVKRSLSLVSKIKRNNLKLKLVLS